MSSAGSRLDRLVTLLDSGSTALVRNTAATQLADIQKSRPEEIFNLLNRVVPHLRSKTWETRVAATKALGGIVENAEKWDPNSNEPPVEGDVTVEVKIEAKHEIKEEDNFIKPEIKSVTGATDDGMLTFATLDLTKILEKGKILLGSSGTEYDYSLADLDPAERLAAQKKNVTARLGLGGEWMSEEIVNEKDFASAGAHSLPTPRIDTSVGRNGPRQPIHSPALNSGVMSPLEGPQMGAEEGAGLSKRQINALKRKAKANAKNHANKVRVVDLQSSRRMSAAEPAPTPTAPTPHPIKKENSEGDNGVTDYFSLDTSKPADDTKIAVEYKGPAASPSPLIETTSEEMDWPFERLCEILEVDLFDHNWEIRHGAAMGLREIVRVHGKGAGRIRGKSRSENDAINQKWLEDLACRLCCIFMLDRFGDYVSDNVVAPIRETTSQTMGALLLHLSPSCVYQVYRTLYRLVMQEDLNLKDSKHIWQVCHGGMLGLKYLSAVRTDLLIKNTDLLDGVVRAVMRGLADLDDDVRAVSAATLIPIAEEFITLRPEAVDGLINVVWECLTYLKDDLSASTGSVMDLLAKLCSFPQVLEAMRVKASADPTQSFALLVPRLYPFLRHTITSVRSAVLRALLTFLDVEGDGTKGWVDGKALRLVFQNLLVERNEAVLSLSLDVWFALIDWLTKSGPARLVEEFTPHLQDLVTLLTTPIGVSRHPFAMNPSLFIRPSGQTLVLPGFAVTPSVGRNQSPTDKEPERKRRRKTEKKEEPSTTAHNVDGHMIQGDIDLVGFDTIVKTKISGAKALGKVIALWPQDAAVDMFMSKIIPLLSSPSGSTQMIAAMIIEEYHKGHPGSAPLKSACMEKLLEVLNSDRPPMYQDIVSFMHIVRSQCHALLNTFATHGKVATSRLPILAVLCQGEPDAGPESFSIEKAEKIVTDDFTRLKKGMMSATKLLSTQQLNDARNTASAAITEAKAAKAQRDARVFAAAAAAYIASGELPKKVNNVIKGVMESVKLEECVDLQKRSALAVADLVGLCSRCGKTNVSDKVTKNLMAFLCVDTSEVPIFHLTKELRDTINTLRKEEDRKEHDDPVQYERDQRAAKIKRLGAKEALEALAVMFGADLFTKVPKIWSSIEAPLHAAFDGELPANVTDPDVTLAQEVIDGMSQLRALLPKFHQDLHPAIIDLFPLIIKALQSSFSVIRYAAAKCFATICSVIRIEGMTTLVEKVLPMIGNAVDLNCRQGAVECVYHLIHVMEEDILPYVVFLIVPILGRMSDSDNDVRLISTTNFATLVKLVPLEAGIPDPPGLSAELLAGRDRERQFIAQMLDVRKVEPFELPVAINATLRSYQQEGVNWLAFLNKYHLHGILCDDMGLGKTLQTICMVASDHYLRAEEFKKTSAPEYGRLPSLIVCPPSLSGHWAQEIKQFAPFLTAVCYVGSPAERARVKQQILAADIVITSYDICRNDNIFICSQRWNYCVLDEGHIIKNAKAKLTQAVKKIAANHRLILSGTPIQNNVLELWSLFDFLMPGFLGTEKVFLDRFAKPIAASRNSKSNSKEQEAGALAIEALHKQVLPFLLRRLKEEVLDDLPPKIIQNYYCELSELQKKLYEDFAKKQAPSVAEQIGAGDKSAKTHIFQALQYMRKLCNSPTLVLNEKHPQYEAVKHQMLREGTTIRDPIHAPKLGALRDLLVDMGIGVQPSTTSPNMLPTETSAISQHRALIFCQLKEMCDIVENDVFKKLLPGLTFMRMDGSTPATKRQDIVTKFNGDPSIDVLLLTTHVGGLGLNLTGADTVIFVEHDWNPQKDMQAMDRAHRIGQKKVVNVYRLITRGTLEEKIMSLQRFKLDVASTVINQQNAGLQTMETDQLLDLFSISETIPTAAEAAEEDMVDATTGQVKQKGTKSVLDDMGELWDESQYTDEYDLGNFIASLK